MVSVHRHVATIHSMMERDEAELGWIAATRVGRKHRGALLLTPRRLLWSGLGALSQSQASFRLAFITTVAVQPHEKLARLTIDCAGTAEVFEGRAADIERIEAMLRDAWAPFAATRATTPEPLIEELERLARLRDAGALTADEFDAAKAQLLA